MAKVLADSMPGDGVLFNDSVSTGGFIFEAMQPSVPGSYVGCRGQAIGWGMGATLGIKAAQPERPVVGLIGDGSAMMTIQGLWTAVNSNIPVVYVICNNGAYRILKLNMNVYMSSVIKETQRKSKYLMMDFPTPFDMVTIASGFGAWAKRVERADEVGPALREAIACGRPAVLDMVIDGSV